VPESGFPGCADTISDLARAVCFRTKMDALSLYIDKVDQMLVDAGGGMASAGAVEAGRGAAERFRSIIADFDSDPGRISERADQLDEAFSEVIGSLGSLGGSGKVRSRWPVLCETAVHHVRFAADLARRLEGLAGLVSGLAAAPVGLFGKRRGDTGLVTVKWHGNDGGGRLADIRRPADDRSRKHLLVYARIDALRQENAELQERVRSAAIDREAVQAVVARREQLMAELDALREQREPSEWMDSE